MQRAGMSNDFALEDVRFIKKITVGSTNPNLQATDAERERQVSELNRCLNEVPRGRIIGRDVSFGVYSVGEHQVVMQATTYHVGFPRRPSWDE